ncbi:hypothetical protein BDB00DRAFT_830944 [Zychaea mexicana]|uniref:uncharacterized protein n=1 Tax=Zychaea mexicana TaxID=64656 RepID=UPI0022FF180D|nr:uncharacterized protein BDB00DRAFT_830944 [Zychaea mexicana]KAI9491861.1 hypothetical protein BDB00DRAFT_830944 [Zychaea mexicana]
MSSAVELRPLLLSSALAFIPGVRKTHSRGQIIRQNVITLHNHCCIKTPLCSAFFFSFFVRQFKFVGDDRHTVRAFGEVVYNKLQHALSVLQKN